MNLYKKPVVVIIEEMTITGAAGGIGKAICSKFISTKKSSR